MKLSKNTLTILRNFAGINQSIFVEADQKTLRTLQPVSKTIMGKAEIEETIPVSFGIYDLNEFLSAISLVPDPVFDFDPQKITVRENGGGKFLTYFCASPEICKEVCPQADVKDPEYDVSVVLTESTIAAIRKAASVFGFENFRIVKNEKQSDVTCEVCDPQNPSTNAYSVNVGSIEDSSSFVFDFRIDILKMIAGDYRVDMSRKYISRWTLVDSDISVCYWVGVERTSLFVDSKYLEES
jgi:hypothetical protein